MPLVRFEDACTQAGALRKNLNPAIAWRDTYKNLSFFTDRRYHTVAVIGGFVGVLLIVRPGLRDLEWPLLLPIAGAMLWALYQVLTRLCSRGDPPGTSLIWAALVALIATSFVGPLDWRWPSATAWTLMVVIALIGAAAHYALIKALDYAEAGAVQPYSYTLLVWATAMGWLVFGHIPDAWTIAGAAVVVLSGLYAWYRDRSDVTSAKP